MMKTVRYVNEKRINNDDNLKDYRHLYQEIMRYLLNLTDSIIFFKSGSHASNFSVFAEAIIL